MPSSSFPSVSAGINFLPDSRSGRSLRGLAPNYPTKDPDATISQIAPQCPSVGTRNSGATLPYLCRRCINSINKGPTCLKGPKKEIGCTIRGVGSSPGPTSNIVRKDILLFTGCFVIPASPHCHRIEQSDSGHSQHVPCILPFCRQTDTGQPYC